MAELGLGIAGVASTFLLPVIVQLGASVLDRIKHQQEKFQALAELIVTVNTSQTQEIFHAFLGQDGDLPNELQTEFLLLFQQLRDLLEELLHLIPDPRTRKNDKLSKRSQKRIDETVRKLEQWNDRFFKRALVYTLFGRKRLPALKSLDGGLALVAVHKVERLRDSIDEALERTRQAPQVLLPQPVQQSVRRPLPNSALRLVGPAIGDPNERFLIEFRVYSDDATDEEIESHRRITRDVAAIMNQADARLMGILHCRGFSQDVGKNRFELHFPFPQDFDNPRSLLDLFRDPGARKGRAVKHSLDQRVELAKSIASALFVMHAADLVHKQVRPDNIIIFAPMTPATATTGGEGNPSHQRYPYVIGKPFLVGFDSARKVDAASHMLREEEWRKNLYLSPERHRLQRGDRFTMQHDLFSLGVVLIEIAFWQTFQDKEGTQLSEVLWEDERRMKRPEQLKETYLTLANGLVARKMGQKYANVVTACLAGLGNSSSQDQGVRDHDGIIIGTAYITEITTRLEEISM